MVVSVKPAANAAYYFQGRAHLKRHGPEGTWLSGHRGLGVEAGREVDQEALDRLLRRMTAHTGESPTFGLHNDVSGHDIVFSAPKAVSLLWAMEHTRRAEIEAAHDSAVRAAVDILIHHAICERVGKGGRRLRKAFAAVAAFAHTRCRPAHHATTGKTFPDPNLHTHILIPDIMVAGSVDGEQGRRLKVPYTTLYGRWAMTLGAWYHAHLAFHMRRLGYEPTAPGPNGVFSLKGIEGAWIGAFSARTGGAKNLCRDLPLKEALLRTKKRAGAFGEDELEDLWTELRVATGYKSPRPLPPATRGAPLSELPAEAYAQIAARLEEEKAVLQEVDLYRGVAVHMVTEGLFLRPQKRMITDLVEGGLLEPLAPSSAYGFSQWTTVANRRREEAVRLRAEQLERTSFLPAGLGPRPEEANPAAIVLTPEQVTAAQAIGSGKRLVVLEGAPGTGKTSLLAPVIASYRKILGDEGVIGVAEGWLQALQLKDRFGIPAYSLEALMGHLRRGSLPNLGKGHVIIVDEAGLLATKRMEELLDLASRYPIKLVFLGDSQQLDPIGAGSGLRLIRQVGSITLSEIHRQQTGVTGEVVRRLAAIAAHRDRAHEGIAIEEERKRLRAEIRQVAELLVANGYWQSSNSSDEAMVAIAHRLVSKDAPSFQTHLHRVLVGSHREAHHVTRLVRQHMRECQRLTGPDVVMRAITPMGDRYTLRIAEGDQVRFLARNKDLGVFNGTEGYVRKLERAEGNDPLITVELIPGTAEAVPTQRETCDTAATGKVIRFRAGEMKNAAGEIELACGYAMTIYGTQGATFQNVTILKSSRMSFRQLYVAISRASHGVRIEEVSRRHRYWQMKGQIDRLVDAVEQELLAMERRDQLKPLASEASRRANSPKPDPVPWEWHVMVEDTITAH